MPSVFFFFLNKCIPEFSYKFKVLDSEGDWARLDELEKLRNHLMTLKVLNLTSGPENPK